MKRESNEMESQHLDVFMNAPIGVFRTTSFGKVLYTNPAMAKILELPSVDAILQYCNDIKSDLYVYPEQRDELLRQLKEKDQVDNFEYEARTATGKHVYLIMSARIVKHNSDGSFIIEGFTTDITERKKTEQALRESEEIHRSYFEHAPYGVFIADRQGRYIQVNPMAGKITGYSESELLNMVIADLIPPEEQESAALHFQKVIQNGYASGVLPFIHKSKGVRYWSVDAVKLSEDRFLGFCSDVTDRLEAEESLKKREHEFSSLMRSMLNAFVLFESVFDETGTFISYRFIYINDAYEKVTGVTLDYIKGKTIHEVWPGTEPEWIKRYGEVAVTGDPQTFELYHDDTHKLYHCHVYRPWPKNDRFCVIFEDITERKKAEDERALLEQQFHQSQKLESIGHLAGGVAHDLNNLLTPILGYSQLLLEDFPGIDPRKPFVEEILEASIRARQLVSQLLAFSRKQVLALQSISLNSILAKFENLLRRTIREDIIIEVNLWPDLPAIKGDPGQLEQVIMNLAINAQDAMPQGGELQIETSLIYLDQDYCNVKRHLSPGPFAMLSVRDNGCGIDAEIKDHIFEPFYTTKEQNKGTGLGLATTYGIIRQHGGTIDLITEKNIGTTFKIFLPITTDISDPNVSSKPAPRSVQGFETILLVEDNHHVRLFTEAALKRFGYSIISASEGHEALKILKASTQKIDLLLTDVIMPGINGVELYRQITRQQSAIKVLFMSGYTGNVISDKGILDGNLNFIKKPFSVLEIAKKVRNVLDQKEPR